MTAAGQALRRRIILAVILLAAFIVLLRVAVLAGEFDTVITAATFEAARENRTTLRAFLHRMPKGGDLHTHLAGAVYAERFIAWAAQQELCTDPQKVVVPKPQCDRRGRCGPPMPCATSSSTTSWSMRSRCARSCQRPPCRPATTNSSRPSRNSAKYPARISST